MTGLPNSGTDVKQLTPLQDCSGATEFHDDLDRKDNPAVLMPSFFFSVSEAMMLPISGSPPPLWKQRH